MKEFSPAFYRLLLFIGFISLHFGLSAQNKTAVPPDEILKLRQEVFRQIEALEDPFKDSLWYHGRIYEFELKSQSGTPYFFNTLTLPGSLTFQGKMYEDLILSYNLILDELILWKKGPNGNMMQLVLNKFFVEKFTLKHNNYNYNFRLHTERKPIHNQLKEGYYEEVFDNEISMFVRHEKVLSIDANRSSLSSYQYQKQVYLILDGRVLVVDNRRDYLKAFPEQKKSLRKYMKHAKVNFEKSGSKILFDLSTYSNSLLDQGSN